MAKTKKKKQQDEFKLIRQRLSLAIDAEKDNREVYVSDMKCVFADEDNGDMWLEKREGRPMVTINKVRTTAEQIQSNIRQNRFAIKVRPVDDEKDVDTAKLFAGLIREIEGRSKANGVYSYAGGCAVKGGFGFFRVLTEWNEDEVFNQDIIIKRITNPLAVYIDPESQDLVCSDAKWAFILDTISKEEYEELYPNASTKEKLDQGYGDDKKEWIAEDTVVVAEYFETKTKKDTLLLLEDGRVELLSKFTEDGWALEGEGETRVLIKGFDQMIRVQKERETDRQELWWRKTNGIEDLEGPMRWPGKYIPIIQVPGIEQWIENKRILRSAIHWGIDPNRLYNWARSISVETMAMAPRVPWVAADQQIGAYKADWEKANTEPVSTLLYKHIPGLPPPQRMSGTFPDPGAANESAIAADDIKATTGYFDASLGRQSNETSGKAIAARQQQGDLATFVFIDNLAAAITHLGVILIDLIPKIYDAERVVRLLNEDGSEAWQTINQTVRDGTGKETVLNDLSIGRYDVVVTPGPAYATKRLEAADAMANIMQTNPNITPAILPRYVKNLDWPEADEIAEELKASSQPPQQQQPSGPNLDEIGKMVDIEGKIQKQRGAAAQGDERIKQLIIEALQGIGLLPPAGGEREPQ